MSASDRERVFSVGGFFPSAVLSVQAGVLAGAHMGRGLWLYCTFFAVVWRGAILDPGYLCACK